MLTTARVKPRTVDEVAGDVEHEVRQVAWWRAARPAWERPGEQSGQGCAARAAERTEPVNAGRSTTWSRWA